MVSIHKIEKQLDKVFSQYIRLKNSVEGYNQCFTCGRSKPIKELQAGHYHSRRFKSIRWNEINVNPQCVRCNIFMEGNKPAYTLGLIKLYGTKVLDELELARKKPYKGDAVKLKIAISFYQNLIKQRNGF